MVLQNDLAHLNRLMTMNELAASLAHEINQPLGAILNNATAAQIMYDDLGQGNVDIQEILEDIAVDAYRAGQIIRKIRGVVKKEESKFELLDVNLMLDEVVELFRNMFNIEQHNPSPGQASGASTGQWGPHQVTAGRYELDKQCRRRHAQQRPSILTVRSSMHPPDGITVSIIDTGPGIDDSLKDKLFDPFFTTKKAGLGIGLRLCRSIIEEHGGRIWVEDNPDGGAIFHFTLKADQGNLNEF